MNRIAILTLVLVAISAVFQLNAQCSSTTSYRPTSTGSNSAVGLYPFSNLTNIVGSDDSYAVITALALGDISHYVTATNFGFAIPADATICGITLNIERRASGVLQQVKDYSVRIIKGGALGTENKARTSSVWPTSDTYATYGGTSDAWSETWTPADINSSNFGSAIAVNLSGISAFPTARIDDINMVVSYQVPLPVGMVSFTATRNMGIVDLNWSTATEVNNDYFAVEYSSTGEFWEELGRVKGVGNCQVKCFYNFKDKDPTHGNGYYRLRQVDFDGTLAFSDIVGVKEGNSSSIQDMQMVWNGKLKLLTVMLEEPINQLYVINANGESLPVEVIPYTERKWKIHFVQGDVPTEIIFIKMQDKEGNWYARKLILN